MANIIILEGLSRTGKSTIASIISKKYKFKNISIKDKMPKTVKNLPDFYFGTFLMAEQFYTNITQDTFVIDRSFLSELVYSKVFERPSHLTHEFITKFLKDNNFVLVNLSTSHQRYLERRPKEKSIYSFDMFNKQKDLFFWFYEKYKTYSDLGEWQKRFIELDTNEYSIDECISKIENLLITNSIIKNINIKENAK